MKSVAKTLSVKIVLLVVLAVVAQATAATWYVSTEGSPGGDGTTWTTAFDTIQAGIDAASDGDVVEIADGTYTGGGNRDIELRGKMIRVCSTSDDPDLCVIDCERSGRGFYIHEGEGSSTVLQGITIENGFLESGSGGALRCYDSHPTITHCVFRNNRAIDGSGGAAYFEDSDAVLSNCSFFDNVAASGGALFCNDDEPTITNCLFIRNSALSGGAITFRYDCRPVLSNITCSGNSARTGNAVYFGSTTRSTMTNSILWGNGDNEIYDNDSQ